ncbi:type II secretion system major pseudopilin GspG [Thiohalorhabdus sp.]|uniref:type II secretion system major pseudopilin GspG n=1 Tax=Thiohalorhabdus sp. TaxID=3094134 RepID=UPI002FC38A5B
MAWQQQATAFPPRAPNRQRGFTLIELMVVVVILGILAAVVVPNVMERPEQARITAAKNDIKAIKSALDMYKLDNHGYPTTDQGLEALVEEPRTEPQPANWSRYLDSLPKDPWGNPYRYLNPGKRGDVDVFSLGPDSQQGTDDDIGSWNL